MINVRPARATDLKAIYQVFYENEVLASENSSEPGEPPPYLRHVLQTGTLSVAEQDGEVIAYAGSITRGNISFLTDLFVRPARQSGSLGKALLHFVLPRNDLVNCTLSSSDFRALALYIRAGMRPQWPQFGLKLEPENLSREIALASDIEIIQADPVDPALISWDAQISGRPRPDDLQYWIREERAVPLWFLRQRQTVGYGYVRLGAEMLSKPQSCTLGPIGVSSPEVATACVLAAVNWALQQAQVVRIDVPGPHPCLAALLEQGFRIIYVDTFVSTARAPFFDAQCYIGSGGDLL